MKFRTAAKAGTPLLPILLETGHFANYGKSSSDFSKSSPSGLGSHGHGRVVSGKIAHELNDGPFFVIEGVRQMDEALE